MKKKKETKFIVAMRSTIGIGSHRELLTFMAVASERGFRGAARRAGVSPSAISRTIGQLEALHAVPVIRGVS